jgi:hypothetical protein
MLRALQIALIGLTAVFLAAVAGLLVAERSWMSPEPASPEEYFLHGSTGTELMPLAVFQILPDLFPDQFQPAGPTGGDWVQQFGFVRGQANANNGLPLGINVSRYRPLSGAPSPVDFVGFNCAVCHTAALRTSVSEPGVVVHGMANAGLDLVPFGDAIKTSVLDTKRLTAATIDSAYEARFHTRLSWFDRLFIGLWLRGARGALTAQLPLRDLPFGGADLRNSELLPSGPGRNQPMRETVRFLLDRTPTPDGGASKIPCIYQQLRREWAQFDGSVRDPVTRNSLAALGVGASVYNLRQPGILHTLQQSYQYIRTLDGPRYTSVFPQLPPPDLARLARGKSVYVQNCAACHGRPGDNGSEWIKGVRQGQVIPAAEVGTDSARVSFRYYAQLGQFIYDFFPSGHPLKPQRDDLRATGGFITAPLESLFSRAPYLHNGSVPTLAELINLRPRRTLFYRGVELFDPENVGLRVAERPDVEWYFEFDTSRYGNGNRGHDYPWAYRAEGWNEDSLRDLLEYLKTF